MTYISPWTDEATEQLKRYHAAGYSGSQIAGLLEINVTRCAVIGKARRLGLELIDRPSVARPRRVRVTPTPADIDRSSNSLNVTFADLRPGQCRSIGNEDMHAPLYCGHPVMPGRAWCAGHYALYYQPKAARPLKVAA